MRLLLLIGTLGISLFPLSAQVATLPDEPRQEQLAPDQPQQATAKNATDPPQTPDKSAQQASLPPTSAGQAPATQPPVNQAPGSQSTLDIKPGSEVIKDKDRWTQSGFFHPFVRMPRYIAVDQRSIWTSPFHTAKSDIKFWAFFAAATGGLVAADRSIMEKLPNSSSQVSVSNWASRFGSAYSLIPISAGFYVIGTAAKADRFRETGLLCFETLIDSNIVVEAVKLAADRARPLDGDGHGHFQASTSGRWSSSFPSGHSINTWAMASIIAHQYPHPRIVPILAYAVATTVVASRVGARQHFPADVLAGSAMGWFIGDYVFGRRHNPELDQHRH